MKQKITLPNQLDLGGSSPARRPFRKASLGLLLGGLLSFHAYAQVTNNFESNDPGGGFPGAAQNGWADTWNIALGNNNGALGFEAPPGQLINTSPLVPGGNNYMNFGFANADNNLMRRKYTSFEDLDVSQTHIVEFDFRADAWLPANQFTGSSDYFTICARPNVSTSSSDNRSTWWIKVLGQNNANGTAVATAGRWNFYEGSPSSSSESQGAFTNAALPAFAFGQTYHFKIITDPTLKTYIGSVSDGTNTFTTGTLRWRNFVTTSEGDRTNGTILYFASRTSTRAVQPATTETNIMSVDNITINHAPFDNFAPKITQNIPALRAMQHPSASGLSFSALTIGPTNTIPASGFQLLLNGVDYSAGLVVSGTDADTNRTVTFNGLVDDIIYTGSLIVGDQVGRKVTNSISFDTFVESHVTIIEAENYNFGPTNLCAATRTNFNGDGFLQSPTPSAFDGLNGVYVNEDNGYVDRTGNVDSNGAAVPGVDYFDLGTDTSEFRFCDSMDTRTLSGQDYTRAIFTNAAVPDYQLEHLLAGEWCNYTHVFPGTNYLVYLRAGARTAVHKFELSRVTSNRKQPNQTTVSLGKFIVPIGAREIHSYRPLQDAFGNPIVVNLSGEETLRLTCLDAIGDDTYVNFLMFQPQSSPSLPFISQFSPGAGLSNVPPQNGVAFTIQNGTLPVNVGTIAVTINGSNVTSGLTITPTASGVAVSYLPATFFPGKTLYSVQVVYGDGSNGLQTNQSSFHVGSYLPGTPVRVNFQMAINSAQNFPGYLPDVSLPFGDRGNGYSYGWNRSIIADTRYNSPTANSAPNTAIPPDPRYASFTHMNKSSPPAIWEITLPNGNYSVHAVCGDATAIDSIFKITVEGTQNITLTDGQLTLTTGGANQTAAGGENNKINYVDITPLDFALPDLSLHNPAVNGGNFSFNIATINRALHVIEYKNQLDAASWTTLTNIVGTGSSAVVSDTVPGTGPRFYRMRIP